MVCPHRYLDNQVFVSLANGELVVYQREAGEVGFGTSEMQPQSGGCREVVAWTAPGEGCSGWLPYFHRKGHPWRDGGGTTLRGRWRWASLSWSPLRGDLEKVVFSHQSPLSVSSWPFFGNDLTTHPALPILSGRFWDPQNSKSLSLGSPGSPITKMVAVAGKLWCGCQNRVLVLNTATLAQEVAWAAAGGRGGRSGGRRWLHRGAAVALSPAAHAPGGAGRRAQRHLHGERG